MDSPMAHSSRSPATAPHGAASSCRRAGAGTSESPPNISRSFRNASLRGCAREGFFRDARIRSSRTTPTGNACGAEPNGRSSGRFMRAAKSRWQTSSLNGEEVRATSLGADIVVDTRVDPLMPHNAIFVRSAVERLFFSPAGTAMQNRNRREWVCRVVSRDGARPQSVREDFSQPAPAFYKSVLGGSRNLRGFRAGYAVGDTLVTGSVELRIPATSPLRIARFGYSIFMDAGTTYDHGRAVRRSETRERRWRRNLGDRAALPHRAFGRARPGVRYARPYRCRADVLTDFAERARAEEGRGKTQGRAGL